MLVAKTMLERSIVFYHTEAGDLTALQSRCLSYLFMGENLYDLTHFVHLHRKTFNFDETFYDTPTFVAVAQMQELLENDRTPLTEMNIAGDKAGKLFRRRILRWAAEEYGDVDTSELADSV